MSLAAADSIEPGFNPQNIGGTSLMRPLTHVLSLILAIPTVALAAESHGPGQSGSAIGSASVPINTAVADYHDASCPADHAPRLYATGFGSRDVRLRADEADGTGSTDAQCWLLQSGGRHARTPFDWTTRPIADAAGSAFIDTAHHRLSIESQPTRRDGERISMQTVDADGPAEGASAPQTDNLLRHDHTSEPETDQSLRAEPDKANLIEVTVQSRRPEEPVPQGAFRAVPWALKHPSQAWRIVTPVTN